MGLETAFWWKVGMSFLVAGIYVVLATRLAERLGPRLGGLVGALPSTLLASLIFIGWTQGNGAALKAASVAPAIVTACALFAATFATFRRAGLVGAVALGVLAWAVIAIPAGHWQFPLAINLAIAAVGFPLAFLLLARVPSAEGTRGKTSAQQLWLRFWLVGLVVACAVLIARLAGPTWGGVVSALPLVIGSIVWSITRSQGIDFAATVAKTMPWGNLGNVVFLLGLILITPILGLPLGLILGYLACLLYGWVLYARVLRPR